MARSPAELRFHTRLFGGGLLGEIQNAQDVPFQVCPEELRFALVIFQVAATREN